MKKYLSLVFMIMVLLSVSILAKQTIPVFSLHQAPAEVPKQLVVIDPGHGGRDPGKVGVNNALEKEINLAISYKVKALLEQNDFEVILTRQTDEGLYTDSDVSKKSGDMRRRVAIINDNDPIVAVSIHQNSFPDESCKGTQVFYHVNSPNGKMFGELMQQAIEETVNNGKHRSAKSNNNYYMLKNTECPTVIVECGFLSNYEECELLCTEEYQDKIAWGIYMGIVRYINKSEG